MRDEAWFVDLYERRYSAVLAYGVRRAGAEAGREIAAEVFLVAWRRAPVLTEPEELPWLWATARRVTANLLRGEHRRRGLIGRAATVLAAGVGNQLDPMDGVDTAIDVRQAVRELSPRDQEALLLVEWEGVDIATGARVAGCSPAAFKVRVHRARKRLAEALGEGPSAALGRARTEVRSAARSEASSNVEPIGTPGGGIARPAGPDC